MKPNEAKKISFYFEMPKDVHVVTPGLTIQRNPPSNLRVVWRNVMISA